MVWVLQCVGVGDGGVGGDTNLLQLHVNVCLCVVCVCARMPACVAGQIRL
jgi:hypothetical protein